VLYFAAFIFKDVSAAYVFVLYVLVVVWFDFIDTLNF